MAEFGCLLGPWALPLLKIERSVPILCDFVCSTKVGWVGEVEGTRKMPELWKGKRLLC